MLGMATRMDRCADFAERRWRAAAFMERPRLMVADSMAEPAFTADAGDLGRIGK